MTCSGLYGHGLYPSKPLDPRARQGRLGPAKPVALRLDSDSLLHTLYWLTSLNPHVLIAAELQHPVHLSAQKAQAHGHDCCEALQSWLRSRSKTENSAGTATGHCFDA